MLKKTNHIKDDKNPIDEQLLLAYLNNELTEQQKHEVEKQMMDDNFDEDALDGLLQLNTKNNLSETIHSLNRTLQTHITKKKKLRRVTSFTSIPHLYPIIIILLIVLLVGGFIIHFLLH
jgi:ABC-type antimicrobial peptide transport system permease subunit